MAKFIMLVGLPASGKSTKAKELSIEYNATIHSSDTIRTELFGNTDSQDNNDKVFNTLHQRVKKDLIKNKNVIYDATNISHKRRKAFVDSLSQIECEKICYLIATPYEECLKQNKLRSRQVPDEVIKRMYLNFYIPQYYEGWDKIEIIWNFDKKKFREFDLFYGENGLSDFQQHSKHHTLTVGEHCTECMYNITTKTSSQNLMFAALYHDIGKPFVKSFYNGKGEQTTSATYYQHHLVSAYNTMFYCHLLSTDSNELDIDVDMVLEICNYIQWHMQPFFLKDQKSIDKFVKLVGQEFWENLLLLHEADKSAR